MASELFDLDLLDDEWPFEIQDQVSHLFKHRRLGVADIAEVSGAFAGPLADGR